MAFTERYVTSTGGGSPRDGSSGNPWTLAEAFANAAAGDRVNIQSDGTYSIGATDITNVGTSAANIVYRGYNSTIGDLDEVGRDTPANGSNLITTNMPDITLTGQLECTNTSGAGQMANMGFMNLNFSGSLSTQLFGSNSTPDGFWMYQCSFLNTANNISARCLHVDNQPVLINCDFECGGTAHGEVVNSDYGMHMINCRVKGADLTNDPNLVGTRTDSYIIGNLFIGAGQNNAVAMDGVVSSMNLLMNNTAYLCGSFLQTDNAVNQKFWILVNNHVTDCEEFINCLYTGGSPSSDQAFLQFFNRTRDITTLETGVGDSINVGAVTTDTGSHTSDYTNAPNDDFSLIVSAPGRDAGLKLG